MTLEDHRLLQQIDQLVEDIAAIESAGLFPSIVEAKKAELAALIQRAQAQAAAGASQPGTTPAAPASPAPASTASSNFFALAVGALLIWLLTKGK